jgi:hypothetical protein
LTAFLVDLIPPICESEDDVNLINELCQLASSVLQRSTIKPKANFGAIFSFMRKLLASNGSIIETTSHDSIHNSPLYSEDIRAILKSMMLKIIGAVQVFDAWKSSDQVNGQAAHQSKSLPILNSPRKTLDTEYLSGVLLFLRQGLVSCPNFTMNISDITSDAENGEPIDPQTKGEILVRRSFDSAVATLNESNDIDTVQSVLLFLLALVRMKLIDSSLHLIMMLTFANVSLVR